jgi:hypothetical protein
MATASEVLTMLRPNGGWVIVGDSWEGVSFIEAQPISKEEFEAGFAKVDAWKAEQEAAAAAKKAAAEAKLAALGLTSDDLKALGLGGN